MAFVVRPYVPGDRAEVRRIFAETADAGGPIEGFFHDRELAADLVTGPFLDVEPEWSWVAESDGKVAGYLTGAVRTDFRRRWKVAVGGTKAFLRAAGRRTFWRRSTARMAAAGFLTFLRGGATPSVLRRYPASLHIDLDSAFRGAGLGRRLMDCFIDQARSLGVPGVHAVVRGDNRSAHAFFRRMGFVELARRPYYFPQGNALRDLGVVIFGKTL
jgi:ribosomal protein S18 acetylase RimI-like enzyme